MNYKNWITCTPVAFRGDEKTFFSRDSGLCCRALQALGASAKVVMPEPVWDDEPDVLRAPYGRLSDPGFWREQGVDAVILYSWAHPRYTSIAEAIRASGLKLYLNMDMEGLISPFVESVAYVRMMWAVQRQKRGVLFGTMNTLCRLGWQCIGLHKHFSRLRHMDCADAIGVVSPIAAERVRKYARFLGRNDIAKKVHFVPHPIDQTMHYASSAKQEQVVAVGRWDDFVQKRPDVLIEVAAKVLAKNSTVRFVIAGKDSGRCAAEIAANVPEAKNRVVGYERLEHDELCEQMSRAQISLCTSRYESFHIASGEALLCGCSIVAPKSPCLPSLPYFIDGNFSGRLAENNPDALADAVLAELDAWKFGERDAAAIAHIWRERISSGAVIRQIDVLLSTARNR
ncbi:MAG: glycosyltransferase [Kiritimatiellaceae bacterium]|nr:glycosyltransferase [Kiritimatiellaceae bacterium]